MQKIISITFALFCVLIPSGIFAQGTVVILDTFNDDTVGVAPGTPEIGSVTYLPVGTYTVIDDYGSPSLRIVDSSPTINPNIITWTAIANPTIFEASYSFRLESFTANGSSALAFQSLGMDGGSSGSTIFWNTNGTIGLDATFVVFPWLMNTTYQVRFRVDCTTDKASLWIDGAALFTDQSIFACNTLSTFGYVSDWDSLSSVSLDEVKVIAGESIFADGFESGDTSKWSSTKPPAPLDGETCATAKVFTTGTLLGDLSDNTPSGAADTCSSGNTIDEWISYTAPCFGIATFSTCLPGTLVDTVISTWDSCPVGTETFCNDDAPGALPECDLNGNNRKSLLSFPVSGGTTYYIRVSAFTDAVGAYEFEASCADI